MGAPHVVGKDQRKPDHFGGSGSCKNASRDIYFVSHPNGYLFSTAKGARSSQPGGICGKVQECSRDHDFACFGGMSSQNGNGCFPLTYHADNFDNGKIEGWLYTGEP